MAFEIRRQLVREETFTFMPNDGTPEITLLSGQLRKWLLDRHMSKVINLTFPDEETEKELIERHGLERSRMASMTLKEASEPVIVGAWPDGTHTLIDGAHRRWFWWKRGINGIKGWVVPKEVWEQFIFNPNAPGVYHHPDGSLLPQRKRDD